MAQIYALLVGISTYMNKDIAPLPASEKDLSVIRFALNRGLRTPNENIRICGSSGVVFVSQFARAITEYTAVIQEEDTFIFYFSGHGKAGHLLFSDQAMSLQSIIDYIDRLKSKNKIILLDSCESGDFKTAGTPRLEINDTISEFAGHGYAVMASSAANEPSRMHPEYRMSLYTSYLVAAMLSPNLIKKGKKSLADINEAVIKYARDWNERNKDREQQPIFRSSLGGTIFFDVEEYHPYEQKEIYMEMDDYIIYSVEPIHSLAAKRLAVNVIPRYPSTNKELADITKQIVKILRRADVYSNEKSEQKFKRKPVNIFWCYFGNDESDLVNHRYFAKTTWVDRSQDREKWFQPQKDSEIIGDVHVWNNSSYKLIRKMQEITVTNEEYIELLKPLMTQIISLAEQFIAFFHEYQNGVITEEELTDQFESWRQRITRLYLSLTDLPMEPDELHNLTEEMYNLAGAVHDFTLLYANRNAAGRTSENKEWLMNHAVRRYYSSIEKLKVLM